MPRHPATSFDGGQSPGGASSKAAGSKWGVGVATACLAGFDAIPLCASIGAVAGYAFPLVAGVALLLAGADAGATAQAAVGLAKFWTPHTAMVGAAIGGAGGLCAGAFMAYQSAVDAIAEALDDPRAPQTFGQKLAERRELIAADLGFKAKGARPS